MFAMSFALGPVWQPSSFVLVLRHIFDDAPSVDSVARVAVTVPVPLAVKVMTRSAPAVSVVASSFRLLKVTTASGAALADADGDALGEAEADGEPDGEAEADGGLEGEMLPVGEITGDAPGEAEPLACAPAVDDGASVADGPPPPLSSVVARSTPTSTAKMNARTMTIRCKFVMR
jgi:hypothetical protein